MAQNTTASAQYTWTQLTDADASTVTVQNLGPDDIEIMATTSESTPASTVKGIRIPAGYAVIGKALSTLFPGLSTPVRLYARLQDVDMPNQNAEIFFSHD